MNCLVIDDEPHAAAILTDYINSTPGLILSGTFTNPLLAMESFSSANPPELTFLDVDMPEISGMDLAGMIRDSTTVVFTTSYPEYAVAAFEKDAADYLLKPISYERFLTCVQKIRSKQMAARPADHFFVKTGTKGKIIRVNISEIRYIVSMGNYVEIHLDGAHKVIAYMTLEELLQQLPQKEFLRTHRSFIVSRKYIMAVEPSQIRLPNEVLLPIGKTYKQHFLREMQASLLISKREN